MSRAGKEKIPTIRFGHPSPERCRYPSDNENPFDALLHTRRPSNPSKKVFIDVSSGEEHPSAAPTASRKKPKKVPKRPLQYIDVSSEDDLTASKTDHVDPRSTSPVPSPKLAKRTTAVVETLQANPPGPSRSFTTIQQVMPRAPPLNLPAEEEDIFFVVKQGSHPGVYKGRFAAEVGCGRGVYGVLQKCPTEDVANKIFVTAFMNREIIRFE